MIHADHISPETIGNRLRQARESANVTQALAASRLGIARTTLVAIEQGRRKIRIAELQRLAHFYGTDANTILRDTSVHVDLIPRFRKAHRVSEEAVQHAAKLLSDLVLAEVELERLLGIRRTFNLPFERPILPGDELLQAESDALEFRQMFGLGQRPIEDIVGLLEFDIGARIYIRRIDPTLSGLFVYEQEVGPCMLLNANHPLERRNQTAAHEIGHLISTRQLPEVLFEEQSHASKEERYASAFGRSLLTPERGLKQRFLEVTAGADCLTRRHVIILAHTFSVSREAIIRRLQDLSLVSKDTWDWFKDEGGITNEDAQAVLGELYSFDTKQRESDRPTTLRLLTLADEALRRDLLSEGQLAKLLRLNRVQLRQQLGVLNEEGSAPNGAPKLPH